jgi:hypothetical protein
MTTFYKHLLPYGTRKGGAVPQTSQGVENLRHSIVSKHSDLIDIIELSKSFSIEGCPEISDTYLGPLEKPHTLSALKRHNVIKARKILGQNVDKSGCGMVGRFNAVYEAALVFLLRIWSDQRPKLTANRRHD